ncbi:MAG: tetratricopeptide repeat-containing sensor histidine kinase [Mongoliitalea sp.]
MLILLIFLLFQQAPTLSDSLKKEIYTTKDPIVKADIYYQVAKANYAIDQDLSIAYADSAIRLAEKHGLAKVKANSLNIKGVSFLIKSSFDSAMQTHINALKIRESIQDTIGLMESHLNIGNILYRTGNGKDAAQRYKKSLEYALLSDNQRALGLLYNNLGSYFKDLWAETNNIEDLDSAKYYLEKSISIKTSLQDIRGSINTINLLAEVARENKDYVTAQKLLTQALEYSNGLQNSEIQISLLYELASFNLEINNTTLALRYAQQAMELANNMNSPYQIGSAAGILSSVYESLGDYKNANEYTKLKLNSEQKLNNEQTKKIREELLIKYEAEKKEEQNKRLLQEQQLLDIKVERKNELLLSATILFVILIFGWVFQKRKNNQLAAAHTQTTEILKKLEAKNLEIAEKTRELEHSNNALVQSNRSRQLLFSVLSHDLKSPIASLQSLLELESGQHISQEEFHIILPKISEQIKSVRGLMESILEWAHRELHEYSMPYVDVAVRPLVQEIIGQFSMKAQEKNLHLINDIPVDVIIYTEKDRLNFIIRNLISNAIKYTPTGGSIRIHYDKEAGDKIKITDTGLGMEKDKLESLFAGRIVSKLGTIGEKGSGIGLLLCKEFAYNLGAMLEVISQVNKGTTFSIQWKK